MLRFLFPFIGLVLVVTLRLLDMRWEPYVGAHLSAIDLVLDFLIFLLGGQLTVNILAWFWRRQKRMPANQRDTVIAGLQNIYYLLLAGASLITILGFWGIDFHTLFTTLSIVAAAIAIISKDYISEIISGIIISFSREISINDYIKIGEHKGKIIDLSITKIALLNEDDEVVYIPNNTVYSSEVINYTKRGLRRVNIGFAIDLAAIDTIDNLEQDLIEAVSSFGEYIEPDSYNLRITELTKDSMQCKFSYIIKKREREIERDIRKKT
ncbi:MAG: mechanosensitive ion channel family protein, partial [Lewinella sp.]|nr:mechanosensitive ion channel family protein [Lewinella sp.]